MLLLTMVSQLAIGGVCVHYRRQPAQNIDLVRISSGIDISEAVALQLRSLGGPILQQHFAPQ